MISVTKILGLFALIVIGSSFSTDSPAYESQADLEGFFDDENLLIVDMRWNNRVLTEDLFIYSNSEITLVPLQALFDAIEFPIIVDFVEGTASGWYISPNRKFELSIKDKMLEIDDSVKELTANDKLVEDGFDLYVDLKLINQWLPITLELRLSQLRLILTSEEELPLQKRIAREQARKGFGATNKVNLPLIGDSYRWLGEPVIDSNLTSRIRDRDDEQGRRAGDIGYFFQGNMDLLKTQANFSLSRAGLDDDASARIRLSKSRNKPDDPLYSGLSYFETGDIFSVSDPLIFNSGSGFGINLEFGSASSQSEFGLKVIQGDANPGWEVEVYRNNALVAFQTVSDDGRYLFEDLPLDYGENTFDVRLFGPQGQEETRRESITIGNQALPVGESYSRLHFTNLNESVLPNNASFSGDETSDESEQIGYFTFARGINNNLSLNVVAAEHGNPQQTNANRNYFGLGINASMPSYALGLQRISELGHGDATGLNLQSRIQQTSVTLTHKEFDSFSSDRSADGKLEQESELRLSTFFGSTFSSPVTHQLIADYEKNQDTGRLYRLENRLGFNVLGGRVSWDHLFNHSQTDISQQGSLRYLRATSVNINVRASLLYRRQDSFEVTGATFNSNWYPAPDWNIQFALASDFIGQDNNAFSIGSSWTFEKIRLSTNASLVEGGGGFISMSIDFSLQKRPNKWQMSADRQSDYGALHSHVFLDKDADGLYSPGDEPLAGVAFEGVNRWRKLETDSAGHLTLPYLRGSTPTTVKLDQGSLEDPFWQSSFKAAQFVSHPGGNNVLNVPIRETAEIEGSIALSQHDQSLRDLPGIPIVLRNSFGEIVANTISEFDGYFVFNMILPGSYTIEIDPKVFDRLGVKPLKPITVNVDEGVLYIDKMVLDSDI